jgi:hypothetical protein
MSLHRWMVPMRPPAVSLVGTMSVPDGRFLVICIRFYRCGETQGRSLGLERVGECTNTVKKVSNFPSPAELNVTNQTLPGR